VPIEQIAPRLAKVFAAFKAERSGSELFGDYCTRVGLEKVKALFSA
jgi:sulfite reductase (ferredoxin)